MSPTPPRPRVDPAALRGTGGGLSNAPEVVMAFRAAVVGLGYWGPNLSRNLSASPSFELVGLVDTDPKRLAKQAALYPAAKPYTDLAEMMRVEKPELVAIATPVGSHAALARIALDGGAHVLVEKPLALSGAECRTLLAHAASVGRHVFVDHTFLFTGAVQELKRQVDSGQLGKLHYIDSVRINLGLFQPDVDVIWDLAPHDLAILQHVVGRAPRTVTAINSCHSPSGFVDVAYVHLDYGDSLTAHLHLSWLSPVKVRRMIFAGERQSTIYDDLEPAEKIKIYDQGVAFDVNDQEARRRVLVSYRKGDMRAPNIPALEALGVELENIAAVLAGRATPTASGEDGAAVVRVLEAAQRSLREGSRVVGVEAA
jgi:predicted dehydrogenase